MAYSKLFTSEIIPAFEHHLNEVVPEIRFMFILNGIPKSVPVKDYDGDF